MPFTIPLLEHLGDLLHFLAIATPVFPEHVPAELVTMNSVVCIRDADRGGANLYELVYPFDADGRPMGTSVTAPLGAAIFGRYVGERVTWRTPQGVGRGVIDALQYQPEREGHYDR